MRSPESGSSHAGSLSGLLTRPRTPAGVASETDGEGETTLALDRDRLDHARDAAAEDEADRGAETPARRRRFGRKSRK